MMKLISTFALLSTATASVGGTSLRGRSLGNQAAGLSTVRIERGYTQATQVGLTVRRGITATMHYTIQFNGITWQQVKTATENYIATQHGSQKSQSESAFANGHAGVNGFWSFLGLNVGASGGWNSASSSNSVSGDQAAHMRSLFSNIGSMAKQDITLTGDITAVGTSEIPATGFVFVRVLSFHFEDGRTFTAVDTSGAPNSAIAADSNGDSSSLITTTAPPAQLNIVPASRRLPTAQNITLSGNITAGGQSYIPTGGAVFASRQLQRQPSQLDCQASCRSDLKQCVSSCLSLPQHFSQSFCSNFCTPQFDLCKSRCTAPAYSCDTQYDFVLHQPYDQISLTDACDASGSRCNANPVYGGRPDVANAMVYCEGTCDRRSGCGAFFFQRHRNGHEICGFFDGAVTGARVANNGANAAGAICTKNH